MSQLSQAQPVTLDGRSFHGIVLEAGKTEGDADTPMFADGRFGSTACDRHGYGDGTYTARRDGDRIQFDAETERAQWGRLQWHGMVTGHRLDGTLTMVRDGATAGEKWVLAGSAEFSPASPWSSGCPPCSAASASAAHGAQLDVRVANRNFNHSLASMGDSSPTGRPVAGPDLGAWTLPRATRPAAGVPPALRADLAGA
ncbi:MAG: hypothetical protein H0W48_12590 [Methylibium sp.]|nr:hypothetical protein [Methylibium sp.]